MKNDNTNQCHICNENFSTKRDIFRHLALIHKTKKYHKCENCGIIFPDKVFLERHIQSIHEGTKVNCKICDESFVSEENLKSHCSAIHKEKKPYKCDKCSKTYTSK